MKKLFSLMIAFALLLSQVPMAYAVEEIQEQTSTSTTYDVSDESSLKEAIKNAKPNDIIRLTKDIIVDGYEATEKIAIDNAITLDLNQFVLTTECGWAGIYAKGGCSIINGTINHTGNTAAIKAFQVDRIEDVKIIVTPTEGKIKGGIVVQEGVNTYVKSIKNVSISGVTNGIETYNCGDSTTPIIGSLENVKINASDVALLLSAPVGTAKDCTFTGGNYGVKMYRKGTYSVTLTLDNCEVSGNTAIYVYDENFNKPSYNNTGKVELIIDKDSALTSTNGEPLTIECGIKENVNIQPETDFICSVTDTNNSVKYYGNGNFKDAIKFANTNGGTVTLLDNITLGEKIDITNNVTIKGNYTITRDKSYTGTLFNVNTDAALTLDSGLTIDGANNYVFDSELYNEDLANWENAVPTAESAKWFTVDEDAPVATAYMIIAKGTVNLNDVLIKNHYSTNGSGIVSASKGSEVNLTGAKITHCASTNGSGLVVNASAGVWSRENELITVTMNDGTVIDGNHVGGNHGIFKIYMGTYFTMNGGEIKNTTGWNSNGTAVGIYHAVFTMNGGTICSNSSVNGPNNGRNAAIYGHSNHLFTMNDGTVCHNTGRARAGIDSPHSETGYTGLTVINGGSVIDNTIIGTWTNPDVSGGETLTITGGSFTQDVSQWLSPVSDLVYDETTGLYTVINDTTTPKVESFVQEYQEKNGGRIKATITFSEPIASGMGNWDWSNSDNTQFTTYFFRQKDVNLTFADAAGNTGTYTFTVDLTEPTVTNVKQVYEAKEDGRIKVTLTFSEDVKDVVSGSTTWRKESSNVYYTYVYRTKDLSVTFKDVTAGNPGSYVVNVDATGPVITTENTSGSPVAKRVVKLISNEPIKAPEGWTEVEGTNGTEWTKAYTKNTKETFTVYDLIGNPTTVRLDVKNVDSTVPTGTVTYSTTEPTNKDITVTLKTSTDCATPEGWTKVNWRTFTKVYTENIKESVHLTSRTGIDGVSDVLVKITNIDKVKPEITLRDKDDNIINGKEIIVEAVKNINLDSYIFASVTDNADSSVTVKDSGHYRFGDTLESSKSGDLEKSIDSTRVGYYCVKYTATDNAGNSKVVAVYVHIIDTTIPNIAVKGTVNNDIYYKELTSIALHDIVGLESVQINNVTTELNGIKYIYIPFDKMANYGIKEGNNTIVLKDTSGNTKEYTFVYDTTSPILNYSVHGTHVWITSDEEISIPGWTRHEDTKNNKVDWRKKLEAGKEYTVIATDLAGNTTAITIDRILPEATFDTSNDNQPTNKNVTVTMIPSESIKDIEGWTKNADNTFSKVFEENGTYEVEIYDLVGNKNNLSFDVTGIDKVSPKVEVTYTPESLTNGDVVISVKADEEVTITGKGWSYNRENESYEKIAESNGEEEIILTDLAGNITKVLVGVSFIDKTAPEYILVLTTTDDGILATLTVNEEVNLLSKGWIATNTANQYQKLYTTNGEEIVKLIDLAGNETEVTVKITEISNISIEEVTPTPEEEPVVTPEKDPTNTGDNSNIGLFASLAVLAAGAMFVLRRKEEL